MGKSQPVVAGKTEICQRLLTRPAVGDVSPKCFQFVKCS